jgi:hypothetical protein
MNAAKLRTLSKACKLQALGCSALILFLFSLAFFLLCAWYRCTVRVRSLAKARGCDYQVFFYIFLFGFPREFELRRHSEFLYLFKQGFLFIA